MIEEYHYSTPAQAVAAILRQAHRDTGFVQRLFDYNGDLDSLFRQMKSKLTYTDDPDGVELVQRPRTLLTKLNELGGKGYGDCDDFTTLAVSAAMAFNIPCSIVLAGRSPKNPVHVYAMMYDRNYDRWRRFDLTAPGMDLSNKYKYEQYIKVVPESYF